MAYIEPCCCERQLPHLLREQKTAFFQTSGDVTVKHLMKSVGCMVENGSTMWLMMPSVDVGLMRMIRHWFDRGWTQKLWLLTREYCGDVVRAEMTAVIQQHTGQDVLMLGSDEGVSGGLLAFSDGKKTVVIQGEMLQEVVPGMKMYSGCFGAVDAENVKGAMEAVKALMKARAKAVTRPSGEADTAAEAVSPAVKQEEKKPKRVRKAKKEST